MVTFDLYFITHSSLWPLILQSKCMFLDVYAFSLLLPVMLLLTPGLSRLNIMSLSISVCCGRRPSQRASPTTYLVGMSPLPCRSLYIASSHSKCRLKAVMLISKLYWVIYLLSSCSLGYWEVIHEIILCTVSPVCDVIYPSCHCATNYSVIFGFFLSLLWATFLF